MSGEPAIVPGMMFRVKAGFRFKDRSLYVGDLVMVIDHYASIRDERTISRYLNKTYHQTILLPNGEAGSFVLDELSFWRVFDVCVHSKPDIR